MTRHGTASDRFSRAIEQRHLFAAEIAMREMRDPSPLVALDSIVLLADVRSDRFDGAAIRWQADSSSRRRLSRWLSRSSRWLRQVRYAEATMRRYRPSVAPTPRAADADSAFAESGSRGSGEARACVLTPSGCDEAEFGGS